VAIVAHRHGVNANQLFSWRRQYHKGALYVSVEPISQSTLVPITLTQPESMAASSSEVGASSADARIDIEFSGGRRVSDTVSFQALLQRFFIDRLMQQRQASAHTISSYRDTFRLLLRYAHERLHKTPDQLAFEDIDAPLVSGFLTDLEKTRHIGASTRNLRLTAIRSFFRYAAFEAPAYSAQIQRVLAMHGKRHHRRLIRFLTRPEVDALLAAPDQSTWYGRRDHALLLLAVETGLRVSEISGLTRVTAGAHADITGRDANNE